jgi:hypothetical protein
MSQNYKNHAKFVAPYHFLLSILVLVFLGWAVWGLIRNPGLRSSMGLVLGLCLVLLFWYSRIFALKVQDRLIRLEMRLHLREILPDELQGRVLEISPDHLIGLRFASDGEMPGLVRQVLDGELATRTDVKRAVQDWQADHYRC